VQHAIGVTLPAGWAEMLEEGLQETGGPLTAGERKWADGILNRKRKVA
jgi:hypothetical protein